MTHDELVERVARAIYEHRNGAGCKPWSRQPQSHREPYLADARAAIAAVYEALKEPTEAMVAAGIIQIFVEDAYTAMLAASPARGNE